MTRKKFEKKYRYLMHLMREVYGVKKSDTRCPVRLSRYGLTSYDEAWGILHDAAQYTAMKGRI